MQAPQAQIDPDDPRVLAIAALLHDELAGEVAAGFPLLTRIPSTGVVKFLDHFATLASADHAPLLNGLAQIGALHFLPPPLIVRAHEQLRTADTPVSRFFESMRTLLPYSYGLRYVDVRQARMALRDAESMRHMTQARASLDFVPRDDPAEHLVGKTPIRDIETIRAPELRKLLNAMLLRRLGAKPQKRSGGELVCEGAIGTVPLRITILFSNLYAQLHYHVGWSVQERGLRAHRLTYELLWGANNGWDYVTAENAGHSIDLLDELLVRLAGLCERIAKLPI